MKLTIGLSPNTSLVTAIAELVQPQRGGAPSGLDLPKSRTRCHDIEVILISILVLSSYCGTPLRITAVGTQVRSHHDDALATGSAGTLARRRSPGGCQLVAFSAAGTAC